MRIVSGTLKGRRFSPPANFKARPTTDQARESLFNILNNLINIEEQTVLDLFGGTGAISYEFASRGARKITCIENNYAHFKYIKATSAQLGLLSQINVYKSDVFKYLTKESEKFTLIFADPPFDLPQLAEIPAAIMKANVLSKDGIFILEHGPDKDFSDFAGFKNVRKYGKVNFSFFGY